MSEHAAELAAAPVVMLVWELGAGHHRCIVFVGPDREHLASSGELTLRHDEAEAFRLTVRQGAAAPGFRGVFERGWPDE